MRPIDLTRCAVLCLCAAANAPALAANTPPKPKLIVAISVDQFSAGLFTQYRGHFTGGLKRLADDGMVFPNGYQSHAATETCPGHSTILTGRHPASTGIIANNWYDTSTGANMYCVEDVSMTVPGRPDAPRGPANLKASTLGEWLKKANPASRTFAVSGKDRSAITLSGHEPDGVFWWDNERGFTTYVPKGASDVDRLAPVKAFNDELSKRWEKTLPIWAPIEARCSQLNGKHAYGKIEFDHRVPPPWKRSDPNSPVRNDAAFKSWFRASPGLDRVTLDLASMLLERYKLGSGPAPDLLAISLSATDYIGHRYGNQGPEMCDQLAHLDRELGALFAKLDALKFPYIVALTADHGALDAVERIAQRGFAAGRLNGGLVQDTNKHLRAQLGLDFNPLLGDSGEIYVAREATDTALRHRIIAAAIIFLRQRPDVAAAFTKTQALAATPPRDKPVDELTVLERFALSTDAERSGDILIALTPYTLLGGPSADYIASHGSPWNYDRRVPILFWWSGVKGYEQYLPIETVDIGPTLAAAVAVATPAVDGRCIDLDRSVNNICPTGNGAPDATPTLTATP